MPGSFLLYAGWLIDGLGTRAARYSLVEVREGLICSIRNETEKPAGLDNRHVLDFSEYTAVPALIDAHVHLSVSGRVDPQLRTAQLKQGWLSAEERMGLHLRSHLKHGIAAIRDGGDAAAHSLQFRNTELPGTMGFQLKAPGFAWHVKGRYGTMIGRALEDGRLLSKSILDNFMVRPDHVKIINSGLNSLTDFGVQTAPQFSLTELMEGCRAADSLGIPTMVHANGQRAVRESILAGSTSVEHGFFMGRANLELMSDRGVYWVPTAVTMSAYSCVLPEKSPAALVARQNLDHQVEQLAMARELGVKVVAGTDSGSPGVEHGESLSEELRLITQAGYSVEEAVNCATAHPARMLGIDQDLGFLGKGSPASMVLVHGAPSELIRNMKNPAAFFLRGKLVHLSSQCRSRLEVVGKE